MRASGATSKTNPQPPVDGRVNAMMTTIDSAGRIVIPKPIRDRLGLRGGETVEIEELDGRIELSRPRRDVELVENEDGLLVPEPGTPMPGLGPDEVRDLLERSRR